jgi:transposase
MAKTKLPQGFYELVQHHLPPESPARSRGGRPRVAHQAALRAIWFVLVTGCRWEDVPSEMGCSGRTAHRRLRQWEELRIWDRLHADLLSQLRAADKLDPDTVIVDSVLVRAFGGGEKTGPNPVDRGKTGSKHTVMVDRQGVPPAVRTTGAHESDQRQILSLILDYPRIGGKPGRPKQLPDTLYADRGYDNEAMRALLCWLGIEPRIAKRRTAHGSGLGKVRWVVERTIGWIKGLRRMRIRYDRLAVIQDAWTSLGASMNCVQIHIHDIYNACGSR